MAKYEYDKSYPFAVYITNLGKYNEGELVGEWVHLPTTAKEMKIPLASYRKRKKQDNVIVHVEHEQT